MKFSLKQETVDARRHELGVEGPTGDHNGPVYSYDRNGRLVIFLQTEFLNRYERAPEDGEDAHTQEYEQ